HANDGEQLGLLFIFGAGRGGGCGYSRSRVHPPAGERDERLVRRHPAFTRSLNRGSEWAAAPTSLACLLDLVVAFTEHTTGCPSDRLQLSEGPRVRLR